MQTPSHKGYDTSTAEKVEKMANINSNAMKIDSILPPFKAGMPHRESFINYPQIGPVKFSDGATYQGQHKKGKMHGFGLLIYANGGGYQGFFEDGEIRGRGRFLTSDGTAFDGNVDENGMKNDFGLLALPDGTKYEGEFKNGVYNGRGENNIFGFFFGKIIYFEEFF